LPDGRGTISRLRGRALRGRQDRIQRVGKGHALFRRLPAHRSDGRTRGGDAALRADEAGGFAQS
jgi:hypothetical protein